MRRFTLVFSFLLLLIPALLLSGGNPGQTEAGDSNPALNAASQSTQDQQASSASGMRDLLAAQGRGEMAYQDFMKKQTANWDSYVSADYTGWELIEGSLSGQESQQQGGKDGWDAFVQQQSQNWQGFSAEQQKLWSDYAAEERRKWEQYVAEVEAKWGTFQGSTRGEWVEYGGDRSAKSYVNFQDGVAVFETVVDENAADKEKVAQQQINRMVEQALAEKDIGGSRVLDGQIADVETLLRASQSPVNRGTVTGKDGMRRTRYAIATPLVPDHLKRRAERYVGFVNTYSSQYHLDASLVMAIMETESYFNPRAQSWANAYGLMQIVPKFAGRDTWREIYRQDGVPSGDYLFDPENNVKHGCCYLHLLMDRDWSKIRRGNKKDYLVICSYNCGPGNVNRMVLKKYGQPEQYSDDKFFALLATYTPEETQGYLRKVTDRRPKWGSE